MNAYVEVADVNPTHPIAFAVLYLPFGVAFGYVIVTLGYLLTHAGVSVLHVAALIALSLVPASWKVFAAPIIDTTLSARRWHVISASASGVSILAIALVPKPQHYLWLLETLIFVLSISANVSSMATEKLMGIHSGEHEKGRVGGWCQVGNLGGLGVGGGAALWLSDHWAPWAGGALLALICLLSTLALRWYPNPEPAGIPGRRYPVALLAVARDVWAVARTRGSFLALMLVVLPIGTSAASYLWSSVADDWHVSADAVALVNGVLGGILSAAGCVAGGYLCDVLDRKRGYLLFGGLQALCAVAMAVGPRTAATFVVLACAYALITGCFYAAFTAMVLETIGRKSVATTYNLFAGFSNIPIAMVTFVEGLAHERWGSTGMLYSEGVLCAGAVALFFAVALLTRPPTGGGNLEVPKIV